MRTPVFAPSHQKAALPLHKLTIIIFGSLALVSILGGIVAIVVDAKSETDLQILGAHLTTGHVGVALIITGLIMTFFTVRTVLKNQRDLAELPRVNRIPTSFVEGPNNSQEKEPLESDDHHLSPPIELGYRLYDSLDYFVKCIRETGDSQRGSFRNEDDMFSLSFNHDGQVTRQLSARVSDISLWAHFEVRGMIMIRKGNDRFPKGGETFYQHMDHSRLDWSDRSEFEWEGNQKEFMRLGQVLLGAIYRCSTAQAPFQEWSEKFEL